MAWTRRTQLALALAAFLAGCGGAPGTAPNLCFRPAAPLHFPGYTDSNSPVDWGSGVLRVFHGSATDTYTDGSSLEDVGTTDHLAQFNVRGPGTIRWLEATFRRPAPRQKRLYGWYHHEAGRTDPVRCGAAGFDPKYNLGIAKIGAMVSDDDGASWRDQGIVLEPPESDRDCAAKNGDFASGNGDPDVIAHGDYLYFYFGNYGGAGPTQGITAARMRIADLGAPVGRVWKWDGKGFNVRGLRGRSVPISPAFTARVPYGGEVDSVWGPSIHFNSHLQTYVMVMNRTRYQPPWYGQEGAYVSFNDDLSDPRGWSEPRKFSSTGGYAFYPEIIGTAPGETDRAVGASGRYFEAGGSAWAVEFFRGATPKGCQTAIP